MKKSIALLIFVIFLIQCSTKTTTSQNLESDNYDALCAIAANAEAQYNLLKQIHTPFQSRVELVTWLLNQDGVADAGFNEDLDDDDKTVWFIHNSGFPGAVLTENSFVNGNTDPLPSFSLPSPSLMDRNKVSNSKRSSSNTGMTAWLISPFFTENSTHDVIDSLDDYYEIPSLGPMVIPFKDNNATIAVFQAAIIGFLPPAVQLTVISHGGRTRLQSGNPKVSFVVSGEYKTSATWSLHRADLQAKRIVTIAYKGKLWLCMTPGFFAHYSGTIQPGDSHWMARYVHLLALKQACNFCEIV